jgi:hypothetical protein
MRNVSWFGLEEEEQVAVFLCLLVVRKETFLQFEAVCQVVCDFVLLHTVSPVAYNSEYDAHLFQCHAVLNKQGYPRVEVSYVLLEDEVLLRLRRDLGLEFSKYLLSWQQLAYLRPMHFRTTIPLARSSSISSSLSFADMDRYSAVTEYRFDCRTERDPSCDDIVFWRETGTKDEEVEDVEAREGRCSIETAIFRVAGTAGCDCSW